MRNRAWRRSQNNRVIRKRQGIIKSWQTGRYGPAYNPFPGHLRKWNFTCRCGMCRMNDYYGRKEKRQREIARAVQISDYS